MILKKTIPCLLFVFLFYGNDFAQTFISKRVFNDYVQPKCNAFVCSDFNNCTEGVKDSTGKWIVQPIYEKIATTSRPDIFIVTLGVHEGAVRSDGTVLIPLMYDRVGVESNYPLVFRVENYDYKKGYFFYEESSQGLVDSLNRIIVPIAKHSIEMKRDSSILVSMGKEHWAIYQLSGEHVLIPGKQDREPREYLPHRYTISKKRFMREDREGVMDDRGKMILPEIYSDVFDFDESHFRVYSKNKAGYFDINGKQIWPIIFSDDAYHDDSLGIAVVKLNGKWGMINMKGDTLLPFQYDDLSSLFDPPDIRLQPFQPHFVVEKNGKEGVLQFPNTMLLPLQYDEIIPIQAYFSKRDSSDVELLIARKNGKWGSITTSGQEIMPFESDTVFSYKTGEFIFKNGDNYELMALPQFSDYDSYDYDVFPRFYVRNYSLVSVVPDDGKFVEMKKGNGVRLFVTPSLVNDTSQRIYYRLYRRQNYAITSQTFDTLIQACAIVIRPLTNTIKVADGSMIFQYLDPNITVSLDDSIRKFSLMKSTYRNKPFYLYLPLDLFTSDSVYSYFTTGYSRKEIIRSDGKIYMLPGNPERLDLSFLQNQFCFEVDYGTNKHGVVDTSGNFIVRPRWNAIGEDDGNYVWVKTKQSYSRQRFRHEESWDFSHRSRTPLYSWHLLHPFRSSVYGWNILDLSTGKLVLTRKHQCEYENSFGKNVVILEERGGYGLFNLQTKKYIIPPGYAEISDLNTDGTVFAVRTCHGNIGIVSNEGKWLADTVWTAMIGASYDRQYHFLADNVYCVLSKDTAWEIFNTAHQTFTRDTATSFNLLFMASSNLDVNPVTYNETPSCTECPTLVVDSTKKVWQQLLPWQKQILFDSLFFPVRYVCRNYGDSIYYSYTCTSCEKKFPNVHLLYAWSKDYNSDPKVHQLVFSNDFCISVARNSLDYSHRMDNPKSDMFFTTMLFNNGPHAMLLDSLFIGGTQWKPFIVNEVETYLNSHLHIEGDCANPAMFPVVLKNRFLITKDGLELLPDHYYEKGEQLVILIPWEKLKPYLRKDVAQKIGI